MMKSARTAAQRKMYATVGGVIWDKIAAAGLGVIGYFLMPGLKPAYDNIFPYQYRYYLGIHSNGILAFIFLLISAVTLLGLAAFCRNILVEVGIGYIVLSAAFFTAQVFMQFDFLHSDNVNWEFRVNCAAALLLLEVFVWTIIEGIILTIKFFRTA